MDRGQSVQIRRYFLKPDSMAEFLPWWDRIVPIRERHGFSLLTAVTDVEHNEFFSVWAFSGNLEDRESSYYGDEGRILLAAESREWARRHAATHYPDRDPDEVIAERPGFTADTSISVGTFYWPSSVDSDRTEWNA